jgi:fumarate reductase subunit C
MERMSRQQTGTTAKQYVRPMPALWWLKRKSYLLFMIRELTAVFVGGYAIFLLALAMRRDDPEAFSALLKSPVVIALQIIALPMVLYHAITWINLTPKVLVLWRGEERVSPALIAGANYVAWAIVSIAIVWIVSGYR